MNIELVCNDKLFKCSYPCWNNIITNIIRTTFDYIEDKINTDKLLNKDFIFDLETDFIFETDFDLENMDDKTIIEYYHNVKTIYNLKAFIKPEQVKISVRNFIKLCHYNLYLNSLNYFDISGLFCICNQNKHGYYSPGNSLDICILFDKIIPFTQKYGIYDYIIRLQEIFTESYKNLRDVRII
jgi:hypothetical protein